MIDEKMDDAVQSCLQAESIVLEFENQTEQKHPSSEDVENILSQIREATKK